MRLFAAIFLATFIGGNILYLVSVKSNKLYFLEFLFISYGLGLGFISLEMLLFYFFRIAFDPVKIIAPWSVLLLINSILYFKVERKGRLDKLPGEKSHSAFSILLVFGIALEIIYALFRALVKPIESYDAIAIYAIKAKIFYLATSLPSDFFNNLIKLFPHPDYPLNIPLSQNFIYIFLGNLNDQLVKSIFPLYFIGILAVLYFSIRRIASRTYALLFTFLLATIPQFNAYATNGYADLPLAYYSFISVLFLFKWLENRKETPSLLISAIFAGLAGWTKNEGLMYCGINIFLILCFMISNRRNVTKKEVVYLFSYLSIISLIALPWLYIKMTAHIVNDEINLSNINPSYLIKQLCKIGPIIYEFQRQFFGVKKWNILWPIAFFVIVVNHKKAFNGLGKYVGLSILFIISGYILFYLVSYVDIVFFLRKTWSRFLIHFLPLVVYWLATILKEDVNI